MAEMGKYCKAYLAKQFREFHGWSENKENVKKEKTEVDGQVEVDREMTDDSILYLQENHVVTDGIFKDEHVIFDQVTDEWKRRGKLSTTTKRKTEGSRLLSTLPCRDGLLDEAEW